MYRSEKSASKICTNRTRKKNYDRHRQRLKNIKPSIDTRPPKRYPHLKRNLKKLQKEHERFEKVNYENQILLNKMTDILDRKYIDNENKNMKYFKSLNAGSRKKKLMKITKENQEILQRILNRQPVYSHLKWKRDREKSKAYCRNICQYPYVLPGSSQGARSPTKRRQYHSPPPPQDEYYDDEDPMEEYEEPMENLDEMLLEAKREEEALRREAEAAAEEEDPGYVDEMEGEFEAEDEPIDEAEETQQEAPQQEEAPPQEAPEATPEEAPKSIQKSGELSITIVSAQKITKGGDLFSKPDPYVKLTLGDQKKKTATKKSTQDPTWDETFNFNVSDCNTETLMLELFEDDFITADDKLGFATLQLSSLNKDETSNLTLKIEGCGEETVLSVQIKPTFGWY